MLNRKLIMFVVCFSMAATILKNIRVLSVTIPILLTVLVTGTAFDAISICNFINLILTIAGASIMPLFLAQYLISRRGIREDFLPVMFRPQLIAAALGIVQMIFVSGVGFVLRYYA